MTRNRLIKAVLTPIHGKEQRAVKVESFDTEASTQRANGFPTPNCRSLDLDSG